MKFTSFETLIDRINEDLGDFKSKFAYKRKELADLGKAPNRNVLFKYTDSDRDWAINEGGGTEIQYHLFYRDNTIGYGLGFNAQYVPFANEMSPVAYIKPFVSSYLNLLKQKNPTIIKLKNDGFAFIEGEEKDLNSIENDDYYLFGKEITIDSSNNISDKDYNQMIDYLKNDIYKLYVDIWEEKIKATKTNENMVNAMNLLTANHNLILTGAPGTGKTYLAKQIAQQMIFGETKEDLSEEEQKLFNEQCGFVQFHPSYDYTDFVEGLRPIQDKGGNVGFERKDGVFKEFCKKALRNPSPNENYVFIIDEINRGEISKIFGELFFSIDPGYRGTDGKVRTQYANMQKEKANDFDNALGITDPENYGHFFVPDNVYIIGTMNDIDRSVESMDFAFRRRFAFKEIKAQETQNMLDKEESWKDEKGNIGSPAKETITIIKNKMNNLNKAIWDENTKSGIEGLSSAYHIGASYFLKLVNYKNDDGSYNYDQLWDNHLEGLLREYLRGMQNVEENLAKLKEAYKTTDDAGENQ